MPRKFIDLSIYLENDVISDPPAFAPKIQYFNHQNSFEQMAPFFPGLKQEDLPDGEVWAVEMVQLSPTTARIWTRPITSTARWTRRWVTRSPPGPSTKCRWSGASSLASSWTFATSPTATW